MRSRGAICMIGRVWRPRDPLRAHQRRRTSRRFIDSHCGRTTRWILQINEVYIETSARDQVSPDDGQLGPFRLCDVIKEPVGVFPNLSRLPLFLSRWPSTPIPALLFVVSTIPFFLFLVAHSPNMDHHNY